MPGAIHDKEELDNPYPAGSLHDTYALGWYRGYIGAQILSMVVGDEAVQAIKSSDMFVQATGKVLEKMDDIKMALKATRAFGVTEKVTSFLADDAGSLYLDDVAGIFAKLKTSAQNARVLKCFVDLGSEKIGILDGYHVELSELFARTGSDGVKLIKDMSDDTLQKMFSISSGELNPELMAKLRINLVGLYKKSVSSDDINAFAANMYKLKEIDGIHNVVERASVADTKGFKGLSFEAELGASKDVNQIFGMGVKSGVKQPSEIDLFTNEGGQNIAYEAKNIDFAEMDSNTWSMYQNKIGNQNAGLKYLADNKIPVQGKLIDSYKFMFREQPPKYVTDWLGEKGIPYDVFVK